ncbi:hypothetical protein [Salana multivorans]
MRRVLALVAAGVVALLIATPASAVGDEVHESMDQRVARVLEENPGGLRTGWNEVSWRDGAAVLTLADGTGVPARASSTCGNGRICVYSGKSGGGDQFAFSGCGPHSVSVLGAPVRSVENARASGSVVVKNGSTIVKIVDAGDTSNVTGTVTTVGCA